jgi:very-short-patch-repair endonuclease
VKVVGVIELDDSTHERCERAIRDSFVDSALAAAGIPVLRFSARRSYPLTDIRELVLKAFGSDQKAA